MAAAKVLPKSKNPRARKPWTVRYWDATGQHERGFTRQSDARDFAVKFMNDSREGSYVDPRAASVAFTTYAAQWIESIDRAPGTKSNYRQLLSKYIAPAFPGRTLAQVAQDREGVAAMLTAMREAGLSGSRRSLALSVVRGALTEAQAAGRIAGHRMTGVSVPKSSAAHPAVIVPVTTSQLYRLASGIRPEWGLTVWLMRGCGLRISEALAVRLDCFRDGGKVLRVHEQTAAGGTLGPLKHRKPSEFRDIPVPAHLWRKVQAHVDAFGTHDDLGGYLFGRHDGQRVGYDSYIARFRASAVKAGLPDLRPHGLRHLYASELLTNGVPMSEVSKFLGHADFGTTHNTYSHLVPDAFDRARRVMDSLSA